MYDGLAFGENFGTDETGKNLCNSEKNKVRFLAVWVSLLFKFGVSGQAVIFLATLGKNLILETGSPGSSCSKLTILLVNTSLTFQMTILLIGTLL